MEMLETYRGCVYPWQADHVGHMNVQFYVAKFDEATWHFFSHYGITPTYQREEKRGMAALEQHIYYHREVLPGSLIVIKSKLLEVKEKVFTYEHYMEDGETGEKVATMKLTVVHLDTEKRKSSEIPEAIVKNLRRDLGD